LHLAKWSRPEIKNRARELSRCMCGAVMHHLNSMLKTMKHCINNLDEFGLMKQ